MRIFMPAIALLLAGCATGGGLRDSPAVEARLAKALEGRIAGKPVDCVAQDQLRGSEIIGDNTILYRQSRRRIWRNDLAGGCPGLRGDPILVTEPFGTRLCKGDLFTPVDRLSGFTSGKCRFGAFTPYDKPER